jgi:hypothetical protein
MFQQKQMNSLREAFPATSITRGIGGVVLVIVSALALYYLYRFLYGLDQLETTVIYAGETIATSGTEASEAIPDKPLSKLYEGGEFSITTWVYITAYKDGVGKNKHILEIKGDNFSTLLIGLGATTNKLMVRVHTTENQLKAEDVKKMFTEVSTSDSGVDNVMCDLPEIELQRYVCLGVVLNGRTVDVYLDGKLARSCILPTFYKVDRAPKARLLDYGGFDGYLSDAIFYNYALNPDQIYRIYMAGPTQSAASGFIGWLSSIFNLQGTVSYKYPQVGVQYQKGTLSF